MSKPVLPFLEMMVINSCNLSCQGCTTFSDLRHSGYVTWQQGREQLVPWLERIDLQAFGFMGGEPLMNPDIENWLIGLRDLLPDAQLRFITNGLLLERHWWIVDLLKSLGNTVLKISHHVDDPRIQSAIDRVLSSATWEPVTEFGINRWRLSDSSMRFQVSSPVQFFRTFRNSYANMAPHDNDPAEAFAMCVQKRCPILHHGRLYKCGTAGLTEGILKRFGNPNIDAWNKYLGTGIDVDCSDQLLDRFINNFGQPHAMCRQCPTPSDTQSILDHRTTVTFK